MYRNLEAEISRKGITQGELAKQIGVSTNTMSRKMNGDSGFTLHESMRIKQLLNVDMALEELFRKS